MTYDENKFKEFNRLLRESQADVVVINHPEVLGDNYEEIVENLNRLATHSMFLSIIPPDKREANPNLVFESTGIRVLLAELTAKHSHLMKLAQMYESKLTNSLNQIDEMRDNSIKRITEVEKEWTDRINKLGSSLTEP